jgi:hypothetical protein
MQSRNQNSLRFEPGWKTNPGFGRTHLRLVGF